MIAFALLIASSAEPLLAAVPSPPKTFADAAARCSAGSDKDRSKYDALKIQLDEEAQKRAAAFQAEIEKNPMIVSQPVAAKDAVLLQPVEAETKAMQAFDSLAQAVQSEIEGYAAEKNDAINNARKVCREGDDACIKGDRPRILAAQAEVVNKRAKRVGEGWLKARAEAEKLAKAAGPRIAKLANAKHPSLRMGASTADAMLASMAERLTSLSALACEQMLTAE